MLHLTTLEINHKIQWKRHDKALSKGSLRQFENQFDGVT